jgi:hypothetical protein
MQDMQFYPWNTLKAAVMRGGTFAGSRHIDLAKDFALRFEEPIAEKWGRTILREIRGRTNDYATDACGLVKEIHTWAKEQGAKVRTNLLEAEIEVIKEDAEKLKAVGKEAVDELRKEVQAKLIQRIEGPIRKKCVKFVEEGEHIGPGVKLRILQLFRKLANETIEAATDPAIDLLTEKFREVEREIVAVFNEHKEHTDPIQAAVDALVTSHEQRLEREDRKKKQAVLEGLNAIVDASPLPFQDDSSLNSTAVAA